MLTFPDQFPGDALAVLAPIVRTRKSTISRKPVKPSLHFKDGQWGNTSVMNEMYLPYRPVHQNPKPLEAVDMLERSQTPGTVGINYIGLAKSDVAITKFILPLLIR